MIPKTLCGQSPDIVRTSYNFVLAECDSRLLTLEKARENHCFLNLKHMASSFKPLQSDSEAENETSMKPKTCEVKDVCYCTQRKTFRRLFVSSIKWKKFSHFTLFGFFVYGYKMWKESQTKAVLFHKRSNRIVKNIGSNMLQFVFNFRIYLHFYLQ